jgi:AcrR family transcriptional regulator
MVAATAVTARGRARREALLGATAELVAQRGFHGVGIADIGAAAGVSGAAIYRHFATKQELLTALIERTVDALLAGARAAIADADSPSDALVALVDAHVDFALRDRSIIAVYDQEAHNLPHDDLRRLRRQQRAYAELWIDVVLTLQPQLSRAEARAAVSALFGLLNSVSDHAVRIPRDELAALLRRMALASLRSVTAGAPRSPSR